MARPKIEGTDFKVSIHKNGRYSYAAIQPRLTDEEGKTYSKRIHWGTVDDEKVFHPNTNYLYADSSVRERLVFPSDWNMTLAKKLTTAPEPGRSEPLSIMENRLYGDIWLLEQIAKKTGLEKDLMTTFNGNKGKVDDILTVAMYMVTTGNACSRLARRQNIEKTPSQNTLTSVNITRLMQSITEENRCTLMGLRGKRLKDGELCAIDSTSRSAYGSALADIRYGKNKEGLPIPQTNELVIYGLQSHMPIFYHQFPGNMPDSRTIDLICVYLDRLNLKDIGLLSDRGYESIANIEKLIVQGRPFLTAMKTSTKMVYDKILELGEFTARPEGMAVDKERLVYHKQWDMDYPVIASNGRTVQSDRLKLTLFLDPAYHTEQIVTLDVTVDEQRELLNKIKSEGTIVSDEKNLRLQCNYFKLKFKDTKKLEDFELNENKVKKARRLAGFYGFLSHKYDWDAIRVSEEYSLRDEQEKYYNQMKSMLGNDRQRNWSEDGKAGSMFILFVGLTLSSYLRHMWRTTDLKGLFSSTSDILDEMRSIRCIEHEGHHQVITPFIGKQRDICKILAIEPPAGCDANYKSKKATPKRRGRPEKPKEVKLD